MQLSPRCARRSGPEPICKRAILLVCSGAPRRLSPYPPPHADPEHYAESRLFVVCEGRAGPSVWSHLAEEMNPHFVTRVELCRVALMVCPFDGDAMSDQ